MLNSPLAAPATADAQRLEMDQVRTTLSKQDPGQHRVDSRPSAATALESRIERENCRSMEKPANSEPHFACWAGNAAFLAGLHLSVVSVWKVTKLARSQASSPRGCRVVPTETVLIRAPAASGRTRN